MAILYLWYLSWSPCNDGYNLLTKLVEPIMFPAFSSCSELKRDDRRKPFTSAGSALLQCSFVDVGNQAGTIQLQQCEETRMWVEIKPSGDRKYWSMFPLTRVPFWVPIFHPQPHGFAAKERTFSQVIGFWSQASRSWLPA